MSEQKLTYNIATVAQVAQFFINGYDLRGEKLVSSRYWFDPVKGEFIFEMVTEAGGAPADPLPVMLQDHPSATEPPAVVTLETMREHLTPVEFDELVAEVGNACTHTSTTPSNWLIGAFLWSDTRAGHGCWGDIHSRLLLAEG